MNRLNQSAFNDIKYNQRNIKSVKLSSMQRYFTHALRLPSGDRVPSANKTRELPSIN